MNAFDATLISGNSAGGDLRVARLKMVRNKVDAVVLEMKILGDRYRKVQRRRVDVVLKLGVQRMVETCLHFIKKRS